MTILKEIVQKKKDLQIFLDSINLEDLNKFSRRELIEFLDEINDIKERLITLDVRKLIEQKKLEEYPELLGVHHYPELNEIKFLTEDLLIKLDEELARNRGNHTNFRILSSDIHWELHEKVYEFLVDKGILIKKIHLVCPCGESEWLSRDFDEKYKEQWIADLKASNKACDDVGLLKRDEFRYFGYCEECHSEKYYLGELTEEFFDNLYFDHFYVKVKERVKKWDNV